MNFFPFLQSKIYWTFLLLAVSFLLFSQTVDLGSFTGKPFKINGGVSANGIYYNSNREGETREPFTYNFNGNLVFSVYSFSIPVSYNYTNAGAKLNYSFPFKFNRLSLSPKYKWVQLHVGDVSMSFSPYTLSGMPFTGLGLELTPNLPVNLSLMGGRIFKAVPDDDNPKTIPAYKRMGYGAKISTKIKKTNIGLIGFYAKDDENSIPPVTDGKNVTPKENIVIGATIETPLTDKIKFSGEYTNSSLTEDLRSEDGIYKRGLVGNLMQGNVSTQNFTALKAGIDFKVKTVTLGMGYERVDPNYQTLGAYYFTNDLENITVNAASPLFKNKVNLAVNVGVQKDNLDNSKKSSTRRIVANANISAQISEQLMANATFSNFTTTTNVNPDQFADINQEDPEIQDVEELNFRQLSKNATLGLNYNFKSQEKSKKNLSFNYAFNQVANEQGGILRPAQLSSFHNFSTAYNMNFINSKWNISAALNYTLNTIARDNSSSLGPVITVSKKIFKEQVNTQFVASYNQSRGTSNNSIMNFRFSSSYSYNKRHNFNLNATQSFKSSDNTDNLSELTISLGYSYNFNVGKVQFARTPKNRVKNEKELKDPKDPKEPKEPKERKEKKPKEQKIDNTDIIYDALERLKAEANSYSDRFDKNYFKEKYGADVESVIFSRTSDEFFKDEYRRLKESGKDFTTQEKLYISHYLMLEQINQINSKEEMLEDENIQQFIKRYANKPLEDSEKSIIQLELELANYFFNQYFPLN